MNKQSKDGRSDGVVEEHAGLSGSDRRTLDAIFRHPISHNLAWRDVVALFETLGTVESKVNNEFAFKVGDAQHLIHKPHTHQLTVPEVLELRHFLERVGRSPESLPQPAAERVPALPNLLVAIDHHEAKIYRIDVTSDDISEHVIAPYDPHHFLHHLAHKDQSREHGQRAPEDSTFYERIAQAAGAGGRIILVGHGKGHSNAAHHLAEYLEKHHPEAHQHIVRGIVADLSSVTPSQLLELGRSTLRNADDINKLQIGK